MSSEPDRPAAGGTSASPGFSGARSFHFEGRDIPANQGDTLAAALLRAGLRIFSRGVKYHRPRGAFCLSGTCGQCLVRVDGEPSRMACVEPAREGAVVSRQNAFPSAERDLLRGADYTFRHGFDHHHFMTFWRPATWAMQQVARQIAGIGRAPDARREVVASGPLETWEVVVVGAGPAGLAAAEAAAGAGARTLLVEERARPGGRLLAGIESWEAMSEGRGTMDLGQGPPSQAMRAGSFSSDPRGDSALDPGRDPGRDLHGAELRTRTRALGAWLEGAGPRLLLDDGQRIVPLAFQAVVLAAGGAPQNMIFGNNDLPGVYAARGLALLWREHGVLPGRRAVVAGAGPEADGIAALLREAGVEVVATPPGARLVAALGSRAVEGTEWDTGGRRVRIDCDLIAVAATVQPAHEIAASLGAIARWRDDCELVCVEAGADGSTAAPGVFACGEVTGPCSPAQAAQAGARAGAAAAQWLRPGAARAAR